MTKYIAVCLLWAVLVFGAYYPVEAKTSYGPCVDFYIGQWYGGEIGGVLLFSKIGADCDKDGSWR